MKLIVTLFVLIFFQPKLIHSQCVSFHNTIYKSSGSYCGQRCVERNLKNQVCHDFPTKGCFCKPGFYRDSTWNCVPSQACEGKKSGGPLQRSGPTTTVKPEECPPNEMFSDCGNYCTEKCRNSNKQKYCPQNTCDIGCFCIDGYFRDDQGVCVPQEKCGIKLLDDDSQPPMVCPYGEHYEKCAKRCEETCGIRSRENKGCGGKPCEPGCFCNKGYSRNIQGQCVPSKECRKAGMCQKHEEFQLCGNSCTELCDPPPECSAKCKPGCYCVKGYFRNKKRGCVSDGSKIKTVLFYAITEKLNFNCPKTKSENKPMVRSGGSQKCGANEIKKACGTRCGETCDSLGKDYVCPQRKICINGCFCEKGFYRNSKNKCVSADKCKKSGKKSQELDKIRKRMKKSCNKEIEEFRECGNHCAELCIPPTTCPGGCEIGCFCKEGLFRSSRGECIPEINCPRLPRAPSLRSLSCGKGEKYYECQKNCIQTCSEFKDKMICPMRQRCLSGCLCMKGLYRDATGQCVSDKLCNNIANYGNLKGLGLDKPKVVVPDCNDNEEYLTCGNYCIELCKPPKRCERACQSGCFCKTGYFRNGKGNCVRESKCKDKKIFHKIKIKIKDKCVNQNEVMKNCGSVCGQSCADQAKHIVCPKRTDCTPGCFCSPGFYKNKNGECVTIDECVPKVGKYKPKKTTTTQKPVPNCGENENYDECGDHCIELCKPPDSCEAQCEAGCFCETGFYRKTEDGPCIPEDQCPQEDENKKYKLKIKLKCEKNEVYSECGTRCGQMCVDLFKSVICPKKGLCVGGCFCAPGYFRNEKGKCVLESQCQDTRPASTRPLKCDTNEVFKECGDRCKQSCEHYLKKTPCPTNGKCSSGCFCEEGFYKDQYGNCVDPKDCTDPTLPSIKTIVCDKNEKFVACGNRCGQTCEELVMNITCISMRSCVSGCFCNKGLLRDNNGECIPENDCYKIKTFIDFEIKCEDNEQYSQCETRCGQSCDDLGRKVECPKSRQCASGCFCEEGFFRNEMGNCIPEAECPDVGPPDMVAKKLDCGPNEEYNECGTRCGQACEDLGRRVSCPKRRTCINGCFCVDGFFRSITGECVPMLKCPNISPPKRPPPSCDANEEFSDCGKRCGQSCDDFSFNKRCPKKHGCVAGCFCDPDYKRDPSGVCVTEDTCPARDKYETDPSSIKCGKNEEYSECGTRCGQGCEELIYGSVCPKIKMCISGCFCLHGFYRNELGECVPESKCPEFPSESETRKCGENERYTDCGSPCGQLCDEVGKNVVCPRKRMCMTGCYCKKGFYRDIYDNCVTKRQCSAKDGNRKKNPKISTEESEDESTHETSETVSDDTSEEVSSDDPTEAVDEGSTLEFDKDMTERDKTSNDESSDGNNAEPISDSNIQTEESDQISTEENIKSENTKKNDESSDER